MFKKLHYFSGITISIFVFFHLINHFASVFGADAHINLMNSLRVVYRNIFVESILFLSVTILIFSGIKLFLLKRKFVSSFFDKLQIWSGLYLAIFFLVHLSAVLGGRFIFNLDTNFYFGVAGLNTFPLSLFFIPYYALAIVSFFGHIASVHSKKMIKTIIGLTPSQQAYAILTLGVAITLIIFYGLTNGFNGLEIPEKYNVIIGK